MTVNRLGFYYFAPRKTLLDCCIWNNYESSTSNTAGIITNRWHSHDGTSKTQRSRADQLTPSSDEHLA